MKREERPPIVPIPPTQPGPGGPGGEPGVPGWPPTPPENEIILPPPETPGIPPIEIVLPPVEIPPVEIPPVTIPPVEIPPITIPPIEMPEIPKVEIPQMPDIAATLRDLLSSSFSPLDAEKLRNWLTLLPRPEIKLWLSHQYIYSEPGTERTEMIIAPPGWRIISVGPVLITSDYYSRDLKVRVMPDADPDFMPYKPLTGPVSIPVPEAAFKNHGLVFQVWAKNDTAQVAWVDLMYLVIQGTEQFYNDYWQPMTQHTFTYTLRLVDQFKVR